MIGAGLAGLSAATALASKGLAVEVIEASPQAGGRCRSYFDASFGAVIDNGNHFVLTGNRNSTLTLYPVAAILEAARSEP